MAEILTVVKIPISQIEEWIKSKHDLPELLDSYRLEDNNLILNFKTTTATESPNIPTSELSRKRRIHKKRNRMKTRGWAVVAHITNSKKQKCTIYKPFVDALQGKQSSPEAQKKAVENILRANKNKPTEDSIRYFLENTLEYLGGTGH